MSGTAAHDPGLRDPTLPAAGGALPGLVSPELDFFTAGKKTFQEVDGVSDGLGPRFNLDSCAGCHAYPAVGGSSPAANPQVNFANSANRIPPFITVDGPVREARFVRNPDGSPDGGVHDLFTIAGRSDAPGCTLSQPNFGVQLRNNNVVFRIPTPTFGNGLIANIPDSAIIANKHADTFRKGQFGITGHENREGNTGTITRFGWKAQNKSLEIFSGEAYLVEQGVTNEVFTQERGEPGDNGIAERTEPPAACLTNGLPEDHTHFPAGTLNTDVPSDVVQFSNFMRFSAPPTAVTSASASAIRGQSVFTQSGCSLCHTPILTTGQSSTAALSTVNAALYSDLLVHNMGPGLADGVSQGGAGPDEFRTAPLWGLGQRIFFLHDGRTKDLVQAIQAHASAGNGTFPASEANRSIAAYNHLSSSDQQDLLNFLRSL